MPPTILMNDLMEKLGSLYHILSKEKDILVANAGAKLPELLQEKLALMTEIAQISQEPTLMDGLSESAKDAYRDRIEKIRYLQETNTMLTRQSLTYTETLLAGFSNTPQSQQMAYGKHGGKDPKEVVPAIIDCSI